jgi:hypothetical protein
MNFIIKAGQKKADTHVSGKLLQLLLQSHQVFFGVKKIVKTVDGGNISFLMKFTHEITSLIALRAYAFFKSSLKMDNPLSMFRC